MALSDPLDCLRVAIKSAISFPTVRGTVTLVLLSKSQRFFVGGCCPSFHLGRLGVFPYW